MAFQGALDRCDALLAYIDALPVIGEDAVAKKAAHPKPAAKPKVQKPAAKPVQKPAAKPKVQPKVQISAPAKQVIKQDSPPKKQQQKKQQKKQQKQKPKAAAAPFDGNPVDLAKRFDFKVGKVIKVGDHPNADSIYLEEIDLGEDKPRQVLSGLKKHYTPENFLNSMVIVFSNLKPSKIRGVASHAMVLCAKSADGSKVELMRPPAGSKPGERVFLEGFDFNDAEYKPDERINARKKNSPWVKFAPDLKTNDNNEMSFQGLRLMLSKGPIVSESLPNALIS